MNISRCSFTFSRGSFYIKHGFKSILRCIYRCNSKILNTQEFFTPFGGKEYSPNHFFSFMVYFDLSNRFTSVPWNIVLFVKKTRMLFARRPVNYSITWDLVGHEIKRWLTRQQEGTALDELLLQSSHYAFACLALVEHRESILFHPLNLFARGTSSCWPNERARISRIRGTLPETICNYDKRMIESNATEISVTFNSPRVSIARIS